MPIESVKVKAHFRMIQCPFCGTILCWVNPRLPNYCPECSKFILATIKQIRPDLITLSTDDAWIVYYDPPRPNRESPLETCTYPECKCIVSISQEPVCPRGLNP